MEIARDEVRVMTVHGAKGLEAPIVDPRRHHDAAEGPAASRACWRCRSTNAAPGTPDRIVWAGRKADDAEPGRGRARDARCAAAEDEYRRLLYVAMTRAADRLVVAGSRGANKHSGGLLVSS